MNIQNTLGPIQNRKPKATINETNEEVRIRIKQFRGGFTKSKRLFCSQDLNLKPKIRLIGVCILSIVIHYKMDTEKTGREKTRSKTLLKWWDVPIKNSEKESVTWEEKISYTTSCQARKNPSNDRCPQDDDKARDWKILGSRFDAVTTNYSDPWPQKLELPWW